MGLAWCKLHGVATWLSADAAQLSARAVNCHVLSCARIWLAALHADVHGAFQRLRSATSAAAAVENHPEGTMQTWLQPSLQQL
jgi:hypothetical protein